MATNSGSEASAPARLAASSVVSPLACSSARPLARNTGSGAHSSALQTPQLSCEATSRKLKLPNASVVSNLSITSESSSCVSDALIGPIAATM